MCGCNKKARTQAPQPVQKTTTQTQVRTVQRTNNNSKQKAHQEYMEWLRSINWAG